MKQNNNTNVLKDKHAQYAPKTCLTLEHSPKIKGYDFEQGLDFKKFLAAYSTSGFQAAHLAEGIEIVKAMRREKATIFLSCTSNQVSSGNREIIKYLIKCKKIDVIVTSAGAVEEDLIKVLKPFALGQFNVSGKMLFEHGINRIGNIFVPNDRYTLFDQFMQKFFDKIYLMQKNENKVFCPKDFIKELGKEIASEKNHQESILYWASKNDIPIFCPGLIDGSIGDLIYFFKQSRPDFLLDISKEMKDIVDLALNSEKTGGIILGGGISKHFALNANIFREGFDYAVYINTAQEYDGSDSGAQVEEAISWGKVKPHAPHVKIHCDATIAFPLLVAGSFAQEEENSS